MNSNFISNDFGLMPTTPKIAFYIKKRVFHDNQDLIQKFCKTNLVAYLFYDINVLSSGNVIKSKAIEFRDTDFDFEDFRSKLQELSKTLETIIYLEYGCQYIEIGCDR